MTGWLAVGFAVLVAVVVLGFCLYEITWKTRRLRRDLVGLRRLGDELRRLQGDLVTTVARARAAQDTGE